MRKHFDAFNCGLMRIVSWYVLWSYLRTLRGREGWREGRIQENIWGGGGGGGGGGGLSSTAEGSVQRCVVLIQPT